MSESKKITTINDSIQANWEILEKYLPPDSTPGLPYPGRNFWVASQEIIFAKWVMKFPENLKRNQVNSYRINDETSIIFTLHTDIWFPWVKGFSEKKPTTTVDTLYDNRQLALLHTKRLNKFLLEMQKIAYQYGETWNVETADIPEVYKQMVNQTGIERLPDFPPTT